MKKRTRKTLLVICSALILLGISIGATLAYLTDSDAVANTFTIGQVRIKLDETNVNDKPATPPTSGAPDRVKANEYHLIPGQTYTKDPTVTMLDGSESAYVRMLVTVHDYSDLLAICKKHGENYAGETVLLQNFVKWNSGEWPYHQNGFVYDNTSDTATYEFRYHTATDKAENGDAPLEQLFFTFTLPGWMDNDDLLMLSKGYKAGTIAPDTTIVPVEDATETDALKIEVVAHAIQAAGFDSADAAWKAFDDQHSS